MRNVEITPVTIDARNIQSLASCPVPSFPLRVWWGEFSHGLPGRGCQFGDKLNKRNRSRAGRYGSWPLIAGTSTVDRSYIE